VPPRAVKSPTLRRNGVNPAPAGPGAAGGVCADSNERESSPAETARVERRRKSRRFMAEKFHHRPTKTKRFPPADDHCVISKMIWHDPVTLVPSNARYRLHFGSAWTARQRSKFRPVASRLKSQPGCARLSGCDMASLKRDCWCLG
jgi:hypothetical protein